MDIRHLKYFVAIVDCGSIGKASEKLHVAQPSLSQQLAQMETSLQCSLLLRSPAGVTPTPAGRALYRHARLILRQMEQLDEEVKRGGGAEFGSVAIGLPTTMASILAMPIFETAQRCHPGIRLQFFESMSGYLTELLAHGRLDLAILFRESESLGIAASPIFTEDLYVLGEPGKGISPCATTCPLRTLSGVKLVAPGVNNGLRRLIERTFLRENLDLNVVADIDSLPTLLSIAQSGAACTILPASAVALRDPPKRPRMRLLVKPMIRRPASLCWPRATPTNSAVLAIRKIILELVHMMAGSGQWTGVALYEASATIPEPGHTA